MTGQGFPALLYGGRDTTVEDSGKMWPLIWVDLDQRIYCKSKLGRKVFAFATQLGYRLQGACPNVTLCMLFIMVYYMP